MSTALNSPSTPISDDVLEMVARYGVSGELPSVLAMTERLFPGAVISVEEDIDPEDSQNDGVAVVVHPIGLTFEVASDASIEWHRQIFDSCHTPFVTVFRLGVEYAE